MRSNLFDQGFFSPRAEGNIPSRPDAFLSDPSIRLGEDWSWSRPRIPPTSLLMEEDQPTLDSFAAFAAVEGTDTPAVVRGNSTSDLINGIIKQFTPIAVRAVNPNYQASQVNQYLQGNLPGTTLDASGNVKKQVPWIPLAIGGAVVVGLLVFASKR